jgi:hypothetical protein
MMSLPDSKSADEPRGVVVEKPRANVYTVLLVLSFVAIVIGCLCLMGELAAYGPGVPWNTSGAQAQ